PVADGHELGQPGARLLLEDRDGVTAVGCGLPGAVRRAGRGLARGAAERRPLLGRGTRGRAHPMSVAASSVMSPAGPVASTGSSGASKAVISTPTTSQSSATAA